MEERGMINFFAKTNFQGRETVFGIKERDRKKHMHFIGKTDSGKTELLLNMAAQDMRNGKGVLIVDSEGDLAQKCLLAVPRERAEEVVYFNLADSGFPVAFNFLEKINPDSRLMAAEQLVEIFKKLMGEKWNHRTHYLLKNIFLSLMEYPSATLLGVEKFLADDSYRQKVVSTVRNQEVRQFWTEEFSRYYSQIFDQAIIPLQKTIRPILNHATLRNIIGQSTSQLKLENALANRQIVILDLSSGRNGEKIGYLLGSLFLAKLQLASLEGSEKKNDFHVYIDELQSFINNSFSNFLRDLSRQEIGVVSTNQFVFQIETGLWQDIFKNVSTIGFFQLSKNDVNFFEKEGGFIFPEQYLNQAKPFHLFLRLAIDGRSSNPFMAETLAPMSFSAGDLQRVDELVSLSRKKFGQIKEEVEVKINQWLGSREELFKKIREIAEKQAKIKKKTKKKPIRFFDFEDDSQEQFFEIDCWGCGVKSEIPFRPDGESPVFCKNCLREYRKAQSQIEQQKQKKTKTLSKENKQLIRKIKKSNSRYSKSKLSVRVKKEIDHVGLRKMIEAAMEKN